MKECFTCGARKAGRDFRYYLQDETEGSVYYSCNTKCLVDLAQSERANSMDGDEPVSEFDLSYEQLGQR